MVWAWVLCADQPCVSQTNWKEAVPKRQNSLGVGATLPARLFTACTSPSAASLEGELTDVVA